MKATQRFFYMAIGGVFSVTMLLIGRAVSPLTAQMYGGFNSNEVLTINQMLKRMPAEVQVAILMGTSDVLPNLQAVTISAVYMAWLIDKQNGDEDLPETKHFLAKWAFHRAQGEQKDRAIGRQKLLGSLNRIEAGLKELKAASIDKNIITGTLEEVSQKLGTTQDPELTKALTILRMGIIEYQSAVSHIASTKNETEYYEELLLSSKGTWDAHIAKLRGIRMLVASDQRFFFTLYFGREGARFIADRKHPCLGDLGDLGGVELPDKLPPIKTDPLEALVIKARAEGKDDEEIREFIKRKQPNIEDAYLDRIMGETENGGQ